LKLLQHCPFLLNGPLSSIKLKPSFPAPCPIYLNSGHPWAFTGKPWGALEFPGQPRVALEIHGKPPITQLKAPNNGQTWRIVESYRRTMEITWIEHGYPMESDGLLYVRVSD
jgi:hypothetical protein